MKWNGKKIETLGDVCDAVMGIEDEEEAKRFFKVYVQEIMADTTPKISLDAAKERAQSNIGWFFGEGMSDKKKAMWNRAVGAEHPVFGMRKPTPKEAFDEGVKMGKAMRKKRNEG